MSQTSFDPHHVLMKRCATFVVAATIAVESRVAYAEESPTLVRTEITTNAPSYVVEAAACDLPDIRVGERSLDVRYDGRRCSSDPPPAGALEVRVHAEAATVILDADATSPAEAENVRVALHVASDSMRQRIAESSAPVATTRRERSILSPGLRNTGIGLTVLGVVLLAVSGITDLVVKGESLGNPSVQTPTNVSDAMFGFFLTGGGLVAVGAPMWIIGSIKVVRVTASASPTGGSLRVTF